MHPFFPKCKIPTELQIIIFRYYFIPYCSFILCSTISQFKWRWQSVTSFVWRRDSSSKVMMLSECDPHVLRLWVIIVTRAAQNHWNISVCCHFWCRLLIRAEWQIGIHLHLDWRKLGWEINTCWHETTLSRGSRQRCAHFTLGCSSCRIVFSSERLHTLRACTHVPVHV